MREWANVILLWLSTQFAPVSHLWLVWWRSYFGFAVRIGGDRIGFLVRCRRRQIATVTVSRLSVLAILARTTSLAGTSIAFSRTRVVYHILNGRKLFKFPRQSVFVFIIPCREDFVVFHFGTGPISRWRPCRRGWCDRSRLAPIIFFTENRAARSTFVSATSSSSSACLLGLVRCGHSTITRHATTKGTNGTGDSPHRHGNVLWRRFNVIAPSTEVAVVVGQASTSTTPGAFQIPFVPRRRRRVGVFNDTLFRVRHVW